MSEMAGRLQDVVAALEDLQTLLDGQDQLDQVLTRLTQTATSTVSAAAAASVTVLADNGATAWIAAATDETVVAVDGHQYTASKRKVP